VIILILLSLTLSACAQPAINAPTATPTKVQLPAPQSGKATLIGKVISLRDGLPIANTVVRLAEVYRQGDEGAFVLDGAYSPGDITDEMGSFAIENVDAKEYVIVVGDVYDKYQIIADPNDDAKVFLAVENEILDIGELEVDLTR
jgi:hypothetical protein